MTGRIVKGIAGFYYVWSEGNLYECKARGIFRKNNQKPLVGDNVLFDVVSCDEIRRELGSADGVISLHGIGNITEILPAKNSLIRPEVANIDQIILLFSSSVPEPNYDMLNRYLVSVRETNIPVHLLVTKVDLVGPDEQAEILKNYENTQYPVSFVSVKTGEGLEQVRSLLAHKVSVFAGPSGVGKSSLLNALKGSQVMEIGELSKKIDRGKNTTRHSELFSLDQDTFLLDTPGFTSIDFSIDNIENLALLFDEFIPYMNQCKFHDCNHMKETDCAIKEAVRNGKIPRTRYISYRHLYEECKDIKKY